MKLAIASDLHLEVDDNLILNNDDQADILILAGDICNFDNIDKHETFFRHIESQFSYIIYVPGNHEYYGSDISCFPKVEEYFRVRYSNISLLDNSNYVILADGFDNFNFVGSTLWTDMNNNDPITCFNVKQNIADFRYIKNRKRKLIPEDYYDMHRTSIEYIRNNIKNKRTIVISHHAPSSKSCDIRFKNDHHINAAFYSNLDLFIQDNQSIELWIHGHMHDSFDYMINKTRVVCNPRGYYPYENSKQFKLKYIEL